MIEGLVVEGTDVVSLELRELIERTLTQNWVHWGYPGVPEFYWCRPIFGDPLQQKWRCYATMNKLRP
jgi:hypothetical protein